MHSGVMRGLMVPKSGKQGVPNRELKGWGKMGKMGKGDGIGKFDERTG